MPTLKKMSSNVVYKTHAMKKAQDHYILALEQHINRYKEYVASLEAHIELLQEKIEKLENGS